MQELKAALQAKKEENDELSAAFEELERERNTVVEDVREEMLHYLAQVRTSATATGSSAVREHDILHRCRQSCDTKRRSM